MEKLFLAPTNEYRSIPFWSWNCRVTRELIDGDLDVFEKMGFGGVCIHPRVGLDLEYLGDEFMDMVEYAVAQCEKRGLICWLYDDDRFPSGAAGGLVTRDGRHRGKYLLMSETRRLSFAAAWELELDGGRLAGFRRLKTDVDIASALSRRDDAHRVRFGYIEELPESPLFEGSAYIDTTDPQAVDTFIEITHERYYKRLSRYFGSVIQAIFTDEPRMEPRLPRSLFTTDAMTHSDFAVPFTPAASACFQAMTSLDPLDVMPSIIWECPDAGVLRRQYRESLAESFAAAYTDRIGDWCRDHNIMSTGHILGEETLSSQTATVGEAARCYRKMDLPGYDVLIDEHNYAAAVQTRSAAALLHKSGVMCELYGSTGWECDFLTYKLQGDRQAALGVTHRVPHLSHMSLEGEAKRDWPASISAQSPWWERFSLLEDHFARLNTVLRRGKRVTRLAVISPVEALWVHPMTGREAERARREKSASFDALVRLLLGSLIDFDLVSESLLGDGRIDLSGYEAILVPEPDFIRPSTKKALDSFPGELILTADESNLMPKLEKYRDVTVAGSRPGELLYALREDGGRRWLFLCHAGKYKDCAPFYTVALRGSYALRLWDTMTGNIGPLHATVQKGVTLFKWPSAPESSLLVELIPAPHPVPRPEKVIYIPRPDRRLILPSPTRVTLSEPNVLLLDRATYSLDGGPVSRSQEILRLDNHIRSIIGLPLRREEMRQPWATDPGPDHDLTLTYEFSSSLPLTHLTLAIERPEVQDVALNGLSVRTSAGYFIDRAFRLLSLPPVRAGRNLLTVRRSFNAKTNLEPAYLLGDFSVVSGSLAPSVNLKLGDIVPQGYPHYTGNIEYEFEFTVPAPGPYALEIPDMACPLIDAYVDGAGPTAIISGTVNLGKLHAGPHRLRLIVYGNRYNLLGALHNADTANPWRGPDSWRTEGANWSENYLLHPSALLYPPQLIPLSPAIYTPFLEKAAPADDNFHPSLINPPSQPPVDT